MPKVQPRPDALEAQRHLLYEAATPVQILDGRIPAETSGVFFREHERLLCRIHMTADNLVHLDGEAGVLLFGFTDCDRCAVEAMLAGGAR